MFCVKTNKGKKKWTIFGGSNFVGVAETEWSMRYGKLSTPFIVLDISRNDQVRQYVVMKTILFIIFNQVS